VLGSFDRNVVDGGVNGAGWLTRLTAKLPCGGYMDCGWRGSLHFFLREMLSYPACIMETGRLQPTLFRGGGRSGDVRLFRGAVNLWTSTYSALFLLTPLAVCSFCSSFHRRIEPDPGLGKSGRLRGFLVSLPLVSASRWAFPASNSRSALTDPRARAHYHIAWTASACCS